MKKKKFLRDLGVLFDLSKYPFVGGEVNHVLKTGEKFVDVPVFSDSDTKGESVQNDLCLIVYGDTIADEVCYKVKFETQWDDVIYESIYMPISSLRTHIETGLIYVADNGFQNPNVHAFKK